MRNAHLGLISLIVILVLSLAACGGSPRAGDVAPLPANVPGSAATPGGVAATEAPAAAPTAAPVVSAPAGSTPASGAPAAGEPLIRFNLSGGIIGFCDELTISSEGNYRLQSCQEGEHTGTLVAADLEQVRAWSQELAPFTRKSEDNPGGPDSLTSELVFNGAGATQPDEATQQLMFDWVSGLILRLRPQPTPPPAPTGAAATVGTEGLCPDVQRPAMIVANYENQSGLIVVDPVSQTRCDVTLHQPPFGRIAAVNGTIYYPVFDPTAKTVKVWQLSRAGVTTSLDFTQVSMEQFGPYNFVISADGSRIAWSRTVIDVAASEENPPYYNDMWVATIDGSNQVTLLDRLESTERRYAEPIQFSPDNGTLYYAMQPDGLGGMIFSFSGRYDNVYRIPTGGGEGNLVYACPTGQQSICVGDVSADGSLIGVAQLGEGTVQVVGGDGQVISTITPPATDYVGWPVFSPNGDLAFVALTLAEGSDNTPPRPNPGYISLVAPPYTGQPQTLYSGNDVATLWEWLDDNRLSYGSMDDQGSVGTSIVTRDGQRAELSPNYALGVLR